MSHVARGASIGLALIVLIAGCSGQDAPPPEPPVDRTPAAGAGTPPAAETGTPEVEAQEAEPAETAGPSEGDARAAAGIVEQAQGTVGETATRVKQAAGEAAADSKTAGGEIAARIETAAEDAIRVAPGKEGLTYIGADKCKVCHKVQHASWAESAHTELDPALDCESCHGPGSEYKGLKIMKDPEAARAAGLVDPTPEFCANCHDMEGLGEDFLGSAHAHKEA
jgi:hypothetical protein